jgi:uncharacterized protein YndB with AHSA1/START domain
MTTSVEQKPVLRLNRIIAAPRARVFEAWTTPEQIKAWFGPETCRVLTAQVDLRVGGEYCFEVSRQKMGNNRVRGRYQEITRPSKLVYTWQWDGKSCTKTDSSEAAGEKQSFEPSIVTVEFIDLGSQTEIRLTHENLPTAEDREAHQHGWNGCFDKLNKHFGL